MTFHTTKSHDWYTDQDPFRYLFHRCLCTLNFTGYNVSYCLVSLTKDTPLYKILMYQFDLHLDYYTCLQIDFFSM